MREFQNITLLNGVTTGTSNAIATNDADRLGVNVAWATGVTAGIVVIETAPTQDYAGTWAALHTLNVSGAGTPPSLQHAVGDICTGFVRARVTTTVSGGGAPSVTVSVNLLRLSN